MTSPGVDMTRLGINHMKALGPILLNVKAWDKLKKQGMVLNWHSFESLC